MTKLLTHRCPQFRMRHHYARKVQAGFTLIEMMVALAILMLMLAIIFIPLNLGINFFHMGRARSEVQQAAQLTLNRIEADLRQAIHVFPNDVMPGITDQDPYTRGDTTGAGYPYFQSKTEDQTYTPGTPGTHRSIICSGSATHDRVSNTSRLDFVLPRMANGVPTTPVTAGPYLTTYYVRRMKAFDAANNFLNYEPVDNALVLFRAQMPIEDNSSPPNKNVDTSDNRYPNGACGSTTNSTSAWLAQSKYGEPNLQLLAGPATTRPNGVHELITPRGMGLIAPHAMDDTSPFVTPPPTPSYLPETSFICQDSNGDGKIDRVRVTIVIGQFDEAGANQAAQTVRISEDIDLPNIQ